MFASPSLSWRRHFMAVFLVLFVLGTWFTYRDSNQRGASRNIKETVPKFHFDDAWLRQEQEVVDYPHSVEAWNDVRRRLAKLAWKKASTLSTYQGETMSRREIYAHFPPTYECDRNSFTRVGGDDDGGKWLCMEFFPMNEGCIVVSVGSNGKFEFEEGVVQLSKGLCQVYTFDCTGEWAPPNKNIHFNKWCMSSTDHIDSMGRVYKRWSSMLRSLGINRVDLLKIDVEGYEWNTIPVNMCDMFLKSFVSLHISNHFIKDTAEQSLLPKQISFELHFFPPSHIQDEYAHFIDETGTFQPPDTPEDMVAANGRDYLHPAIKLFEKFDKNGYVIAATEYNFNSIEECCQEFTLVRV